MGAGVERPGWLRWVDRFGWLAVVAAGLLAYHNCFAGALYLDDPLTLAAIESRLQESDPLLPHPTVLRWLGQWSYVAGVHLFGLSSQSVHAVNLAIHLLAALFLWAVVARTLRLPRFSGRLADRAGLIATAVAALWVVHPLNTQAVTYVSQRYESQMALFILVSLWAFIRGAASGGRWWWYGLSALAAGAATSTKEPAVVLPFVFFIYDRLFLAGSWGQSLRRRWPLYLGFLAAQVAVTPSVLANMAPPAEPPAVEEPVVLSGEKGLYRNDPGFKSAGFETSGLTPWQYLRTQPEVILHYLRLSIVPRPLVLDYNWPVAEHWWQIYPAGLVILALLGSTAWAVARGRACGFLGVWFFGFLALSSSFMPIADLAFEHRMYLPLMAVLLAVVLCADRALGCLGERTGLESAPLKLGGAAAACSALALLTVERNEDYCDPIRMYQGLLARVPHNGRAWTNLGNIYGGEKRLDEAADAFRMALKNPMVRMPAAQKAAWNNLIQALSLSKSPELIPALNEFVALDPENPSRHLLLAQARFEAHDSAGAIEEYEKAIALAKRQGYPLREPMVFGFYAQALVDAGKIEAAVPVYQHALELANPPPGLHNQFGQVLTRLGRYTEAEAQFRATMEKAPKLPQGWYNMGVLRMHQNRPAEAVTWFEEAAKRDNNHVWAVTGLAQALYESGQTNEGKKWFAIAHKKFRNWAEVAVQTAMRMVADPNPKARYPAEGLRLARLLVDCFGDQDPGALDVLAAALAESGQFEEAERIAKQAVELARAGKFNELAVEIEARRLLYSQKQPYRRSTGAPE